MSRFFVALLTLLVLPTASNAEIPATLQTELLIVQVPEKTGFELIPKLRDPARIQAAVQELHQMLAADRASLNAWTITYSQPGERSVSETGEEFRYPTDFDPPHFPNVFPSKPRRELPYRTNGISKIPTSFETRNIGVSLEIAATIRDSLIHADLVVSHVRSAGFTPYRPRQWGLALPEAPAVEDQPRFSTNRVTISPITKSGQWLLIGIFRSGKPTPSIELFLLCVTRKDSRPS